MAGSTAGTGLGALTSLCVLSHTNPLSGGGSVVALTFAGQKAIAFGPPDDRAVVSNSVTPELLQFSTDGADALTETFSDYNVPAQITPPPAGDTVDGTDYGM